eukprot:scaffold938_cov334-Pavlova_lutheri.AAC.39
MRTATATAEECVSHCYRGGFSKVALIPSRTDPCPALLFLAHGRLAYQRHVGIEAVCIRAACNLPGGCFQHMFLHVHEGLDGVHPSHVVMQRLEAWHVHFSLFELRSDHQARRRNQVQLAQSHFHLGQGSIHAVDRRGQGGAREGKVFGGDDHPVNESISVRQVPFGTSMPWGTVGGCLLSPFHASNDLVHQPPSHGSLVLRRDTVSVRRRSRASSLGLSFALPPHLPTPPCLPGFPGVRSGPWIASTILGSLDGAAASSFRHVAQVAGNRARRLGSRQTDPSRPEGSILPQGREHRGGPSGRFCADVGDRLVGRDRPPRPHGSRRPSDGHRTARRRRGSLRSESVSGRGVTGCVFLGGGFGSASRDVGLGSPVQ